MLQFVVLAYMVITTAEGKLQHPTRQHEEMTDLLKAILKENPCRLAVLLKQNNVDGDFYERTTTIVNKLNVPQMNLKQSQIGQFNGKHDKKFSYEAIIDESRLYFVFMPNITSALNVLPTLMRLHFYRIRHRTLLIVHQSFKEQINAAEIQEVFRYYWSKEILNVVLIIQTNEIYTYNPYFNQFSIKIDSGHRGRIFQDKLKNLNGYRFRMSMFEAALDAHSIHSRELIGRDVDQWKTIAAELNATYVHISPRDKITYGLKFKNGTMTGVFRDVVENITEIVVNSRMVKLQFENVMEHTYPHDREDVSIVVPTAPHIEEFVKFVMLFSVPLWLLVGCLAFAFAILWCVFVVPGQPMYAFLSSFTLTLGNPPVYEPNNWFPRLLLLMYTAWIFFVQAAYHGTLTSVLTVPLFAPEINTLHQLENSHIEVYAATRFKDMFLQNIGGTLTTKLIDRITTVPDDPDIEKLVEKRGNYAIIQKETFALLSVLTRKNYKDDGSVIYRVMSERPMPTQVCYATRYGSFLIPKFNQLLRSFQESGLDKHWKTITIHRIMLDEKYKEIPAPVSLRVLTFDNISIAFVALSFGLSFGFLILLMEKFVFHCKNI